MIDTLGALFDLADACIRAAAPAGKAFLQPVFGVPRDAHGEEAVPVIGLGMGKLGGRELNFSSDIDLIFLFSAKGQTNGPRAIAFAEFVRPFVYRRYLDFGVIELEAPNRAENCSRQEERT